MNILKKFENNKYKVTVEELTRVDQRSGYNVWLATSWNKESCLEVDRTVREFETSGGALDEAFDMLSKILKEK